MAAEQGTGWTVRGLKCDEVSLPTVVPMPRRLLTRKLRSPEQCLSPFGQCQVNTTRFVIVKLPFSVLYLLHLHFS